ncbi:non-ribosomal peptide synthetase [Shewanella psychropiezotolerans]|uniref:non-ribosomal peptide synthetase n=1 Tax=Shewanella psychropiezotolerans TaxID=2593655 RepID=UPI0022770899
MECTLRDIEAIELACVLAKTRETDIGTSKYLVGYYKVMPGHSTTQAHIVSELSKALPEYMVPNALVEMAEFPLTVNGKLDKKSLPEAHFTATENYVAPRNDLDNRLCTLWQSVLCIERVGITDNFFRLGGDSILAIVLSAKMSQLLDYEIKVADIFKFTSIETILADCPKKKKISIPKLEQNTSALSFAQDRLWFIEKYEEGTSAYHIPCLYQLSPDANISWVKQAIQAVVARHDILRTTIEQTDLDDIQVIHREPVSIAEKQVNDGSNYRDILSEDINAPFDLRSHYPIKVTLYQLQDDSFSYLLLINFHHIAADGWSVDIFERDFMSYYDVYASQRGRNLAELPIQYVDYAEWQRKHLQGDAYQEQVNYWKHKLAGSPTLECPTDFPRPNNVSYAGKHECFSIDLETSQALRALAKQANCTLHTVTLSLFSLLLSKYCHQTDIVTGTPIANRHLVQTQDLIGLFINTQVNRVHINASETFKELIQRVQQDQVDAQRHQDIPFEQLMKELKVERDISRHPIFQIMFGVQGFGHVEEQGKNNKGNPLIPYSGLTDIYEYARFDMEFFIDDRQEALQGIIRYAHKLFKAETILAIISRYKYLIEQVVSIADVKVHTLSILRDEELKKLTHDWNQTDRAFPTHKTIHQLFEEQVVKTPHSTAILSAETRLSYRALNIRANQLARQIRHLYQQRTGDELAPNTLIALYLDRSIEMIVAVLAVLKAGAAYVPIDPSYPTERCRFMIEDTQAELVLTLKNTLLNEYAASEERLSQPICARDKWVTIDLDEPFYRQIDSSNLEPYSNSEHLAYVIYTSGTTGKPKGTMLPHRGIVNRITWMQATYPLSGSDVVLQKTPYVFDVSVWELFWAHWYGATLVQAKPDGHKDSDYLNKLIVKESVTTLHFVPSMLEAYNGFLTSSNDKLPNTIKQMFCSGEALHETTVNTTYHLAQSPEFKLHNLYGPTEASIDVTYFETTAGKAVSIGKPINNTRVYVLDENQQPVPVGVVGELYLGGAGLAYGYLNRQALTAARFVDNTFATESDRQKGYLTLYKTGDLVRWLPDGNIDYIGRNDDQVKIRGHRVELDEIASKLRSVDGIKQACVMVKQRVISNSVTQYLVAYYTETRKNSVNDELILDKLANDLPDYMLPSVFVKMDAFPLTINGKLDRRSLPEPTLNHDKNFKAPRGQLETALCHIWQEVVGLQQVGITDNFFRIGGIQS